MIEPETMLPKADVSDAELEDFAEWETSEDGAEMEFGRPEGDLH